MRLAKLLLAQVLCEDGGVLAIALLGIINGVIEFPIPKSFMVMLIFCSLVSIPIFRMFFASQVLKGDNTVNRNIKAAGRTCVTIIMIIALLLNSGRDGGLL